jgi:hypothetical protein
MDTPMDGDILQFNDVLVEEGFLGSMAVLKT